MSIASIAKSENMISRTARAPLRGGRRAPSSRRTRRPTRRCPRRAGIPARRGHRRVGRRVRRDEGALRPPRSGARAVLEIMFSDFAMLAMDMIVNQAAKTHYMTGGRLSAPVTIRLVTGTAGATAAQHSHSLEAGVVHAPGPQRRGPVARPP